MNTRMRAVRSGLFRLKQTKTFVHSNFSSANSSNEMKLSRDPSGNTDAGISTKRTLLMNIVFHSTCFSTLKAQVKSKNNDSSLSAISSKLKNFLFFQINNFKFFYLNLVLILSLLLSFHNLILDHSLTSHLHLISLRMVMMTLMMTNHYYDHGFLLNSLNNQYQHMIYHQHLYLLAMNSIHSCLKFVVFVVY
jgi:hypothetical protein